MLMRKYYNLLLLLMLTMGAVGTLAQKRTTMATHYRDFRPSMITFTDGRRLPQPLTNIFLKNSTLLYMKGEYAMEANMDNIVAVEFDDRNYRNINGQLGYFVDSVKSNSLYCIELFDQDSYERNLRNNVNISSLDLSNDQMGTTTVDLNTEEDYKFPVIPKYYYRLNGEWVKVHERDLWRRLKDKEKRRLFKTVVGSDNFSWVDPESLVSLLKVITD